MDGTPDPYRTVAGRGRAAVEVVDEADLLREWSSDAVEPSGSAGKPALNVLARGTSRTSRPS